MTIMKIMTMMTIRPTTTTSMMMMRIRRKMTTSLSSSLSALSSSLMVDVVGKHHHHLYPLSLPLPLQQRRRLFLLSPTNYHHHHRYTTSLSSSLSLSLRTLSTISSTSSSSSSTSIPGGTTGDSSSNHTSDNNSSSITTASTASLDDDTNDNNSNKDDNDNTVEESTTTTFTSTTQRKNTTTTTSSTSSRIIIPTRHSYTIRGQQQQSSSSSLICYDDMELQERTEEVLNTPLGMLFGYTTTGTTTSTNLRSTTIEEDLYRAYEVAYPTHQLVEYLLRGYNAKYHCFPNSLYGSSSASRSGEKKDSLSSSTTTLSSLSYSIVDTDRTLSTMMELMDRLDEEGELYMNVRAEHMKHYYDTSTVSSSSLISPRLVDDDNDDDDDDDDDSDISSSSSSSSDSSSSSSGSDEDDEDEDDEDDDEDEVDDDDDDKKIEIGTTKFGEMQDEMYISSSVMEHLHFHEQVQHPKQQQQQQQKRSNKINIDDEKGRQKKFLHDFANPGLTMTMYDCLLDSMASSTEAMLMDQSMKLMKDDDDPSIKLSVLDVMEPSDLYHIAQSAIEAYTLNGKVVMNGRTTGDNTSFIYTTPTMVTYNAPLRGIANLCQYHNKDQMIIDQGLAYGFSLYNQLTPRRRYMRPENNTNNKSGNGNDDDEEYLLSHYTHHHQRNAQTIVYMLKLIDACIPTSRTKGNMTVTLWYQASREGIVTPTLVHTILDVHGCNDNGNNKDVSIHGPEFEPFLKVVRESLRHGGGGGDDDGVNVSSSLSSDTKKQMSSTMKNNVEHNGNNNKKVVIVPQRYGRFARKLHHSKMY